MPGIEQAVSDHIRSMPFLWLGIDNLPGPDSQRGDVERDAIALLSSSAEAKPIDPPSANRLGNWSAHEKIRNSGLWNVRHVEGIPDPKFLDVLNHLI